MPSCLVSDNGTNTVKYNGLRYFFRYPAFGIDYISVNGRILLLDEVQ